MKKRILASLLSLVMVLSMFPTAFAAEEVAPTDEPMQNEAVCICEALCTEETVNADCPVCGGEMSHTACSGTAAEPQQVEDNGIPADEGNSAPETDKLLTEENVYTVGNAQDLTDALEKIAKSDAIDATIVLMSDITKADFAGVADKHVTLKSEEGKRYSIDLASELVGDLTADNVKVSAGTLYCSGHRTIFTENCEFTLTGTLYGGGNQKTVDRTYVKINGTGKINTSDRENVVVGGSYKGSVDGDIYIELAGNISYGNQTGGHYLIGTNKGTSYGGDKPPADYDPYVNGNVTLILDSPVKNTKPVNVVGAYNSHVKGNVTVQVKSGYTVGIEGMREDPTQSIVDGNIHIIAGDPAYANTDRICRIGANWDIVGAGEKINLTGNLFQVGGNVTIDTYENVWGWDRDKTPDSDPPGIVGAESAEVVGDVTINVHGSHLEDIIGVDDSATIGSVVNGNIVINATDVDLRNSYNDQSGIIPVYATAGKDVTVNLDGGSLSGIYGYGGKVVGNMEINITGKPVFTDDEAGVWGVNNTDTKERSVLNFDQAETSIPIVGYFTEMNVRNDSDVTLGNEKKNAFNIYDVNINTGAKLTTNKQAYSKGALTMDNGAWTANGYLYVTETTHTLDSELVMNDYAAFGYGYKDDSAYDKTVVMSSGDTYTFNPCNYTDKIYGNAEITDSTWNVFIPTIIYGDYKGTTNQIHLPAFVGDENYPTEKIPLEVFGTATGATQVTLVDKDHPEQEGLPIVGQNYINALRVSENVFVLANNNAKTEGLYFKKVADADTKDKADYDMWQVAKGIIVTFDKNGGDAEADPKTMTVPSGSTVGTLPKEPTRTGYTFTGWNTAADGKGTEFTAATPVTSDIKVYAQWQKADEQLWYYELYYQFYTPDGILQDENGVSYNWVRQAHGQGGWAYPDDVVSIGHSKFDGKQFAWDAVDGSGKETLGLHYVFDENFGPHRLSSSCGEATKSNPLKIYYRATPHTVTYQYDGNIPDEAPKVPDVVHTSYSAPVTVAEDPTLPGYTFSGWKIQSPAGIEITNGTFAMPNNNVSLVGSWVPMAKNHTVTFLPGVHGTLSGIDKYTVVSGSVFGIDTRTVPNVNEEHNYDFTGWLGNDGKIYTSSQIMELIIVCDMTFTAQYKRESSGGGTYYILHYESNGGTEYKDERYKKNTVVELDKVPTREGYTFTGWYADEELTDRITSIKMTGDKTVYAGWEPTGVPDWLNGKDHFAYVVGYVDGTVRPLNNISRAEVAAIFFRLLNEDIREENLTSVNTFADVNDGMWCNTAISTMAMLGVVKGRSSEHFDPNAPITRAEFAAICARFDTSKRTGDSNFTDIAGHWAEAEIERAASLGWIMGYTDGTFRPENYITRAEAMTMINRVLNRLPEDEDDLLDGMNIWPDNKPGDWYYLAVQEATNSHDFTRKGDVHERWTKLNADPDWKQYQ